MSSVMRTNEARLAILAQEIQRGNSDEVDRLLYEVFSSQESDLFNGMGQLTRKLHDSLRGFDLDSRLADIAENDLSDPRARLDYVVAKTEESAHKTLDAIEQIAPISQQMDREAAEVRARWLSFQRPEMPISEFTALARDMREFTELVQEQAGRISSGLTDVMMAQEYQDLTGQVLRRVIDLVQEVESGLVEVIRLRDPMPAEDRVDRLDPGNPGPAGPATKKTVDPKGEGPQMGQGADMVAGQDDVDELLSSLGF